MDSQSFHAQGRIAAGSESELLQPESHKTPLRPGMELADRHMTQQTDASEAQPVLPTLRSLLAGRTLEWPDVLVEGAAP